MWRPDKVQPETAPDGSTVLRGAFLTLFEDDFAPARRAAVTPAPVAEAPPPPPVLTAADVEAAYADGMRAGAASAAAAAARQDRERRIFRRMVGVTGFEPATYTSRT